MAQRSRRGKRRHPVDNRGEDEIVDDLAYAAGFALMGPPTSAVAPATDGTPGTGEASKPDDNGDEDIDIDSESDEDDSDSDNEDPADDKVEGEEDLDVENDAEDDDDEDHAEIAKAIAAMEHDVTEEEGVSKASHKTQHEVDAYNTPIQELEQHLQFRLTMDEANQAKPRQLQASDLKCAGTIKHHMVEDRTVVIESNPPVRGASLNPLDAGTLLLMKGEGLASSPSSNNNTSNKNQSLIPLGRIFETFGPVTRPLYTIRLPEPIVPKPIVVEKMQEVTDNGASSNTDDNKKESEEACNQKGEDNNNNKNNNGEKAEKKENITAPRPVDNWGPTGKYCQFLKAMGTSSVPIYFVEDEAKLIDTNMVLRISGKGCDASNFYDEEVSNKDEMYYSDDEKERQAKSRRKASRLQQSRQPQQRGLSQHAVPSGFHQTNTPVGFHAAPAGFHAAPMPQGFHQPPAVYGQPPIAQYQQYPNYGHPGPFPPPPPRRQGQGRSHPPPNNSGAPPPAYHY